MNILVADDDALSRRMLKSMLESAGYEVVLVKDGTEAAALLCGPAAPRLALLDWMMPGLDGPAVVRAVRAKRGQQHVHMILLTSKQSKADVVAGLDSGADDYLTKPFNPEELRARLRTGERILLLEDKLVEAREEMRYRATHDGLTSLWNRIVILELLQREVLRGKRDREHGSVTVILADIDHFKSVNDTYGHAAGDLALQKVAQQLLASVRNYDAVSRYGGEEFLLVLPGCQAKNGCERAEYIRHAIAAEPVNVGGVKIPLTVSLGVANSGDWSSSGTEALIKAADEAMYQAKAEGRNRVVLARPSGMESIRPSGQLTIA